MVAHWLARPEPLCGEILSGYLVRCAHSNGMTPYRFMSFHCRGIAVWNRDIDRSATNEFIALVSRGSGVEASRLNEMTLRNFAMMLGAADMAHATGLTIAPWINAVGIYHRIRRRHGMQYCPRCLAEDGAYKMIWRLAFVTVCPIHHCELLDGCLHCDAEVAFHRNDALHLHCHQCGRSMLGHGFERDNGADDIGVRLIFETGLLRALEHGSYALGDQSIATPDFFKGMLALLAAVKASIRVDRDTAKRLDPSYRSFPTERIELLRVMARAQQCQLLAQFLSDWPSRFLGFAEGQRFTQRYFSNSLPSWMSKAVAMLPEGGHRVRSIAENAPIRTQLRALHRSKCVGWRTERARILIDRAARGI